MTAHEPDINEIPIGVQDFKALRDDDFCFVDKSAFIDRILEEERPVFLFLRPRRFGKSLNLSMIDAYLSDKYPGNHWFDDLEISRIRPDDPDKNTNPVINLDMKGLGNGTYERFIYLLREKVVQLYIDALKPENAAELDKHPELLFPSLETEEGIARFTMSLSKLLKQLHDKTGKDVILIIDEYDNAVNNARETSNGPGEDSHRRRILDFLKDFLGEALKGNENLRLAVLTGVMRIGKESIFSGLNNLIVDSVLNPVFNEMFGFTESEVHELCTAYGHPDRFGEAKSWYDGYCFGGAEVYNPWSVLNYIFKRFYPTTYWAGTSSNDIIDKMMDSLGPDTFPVFEKMVKGERTVETLSDTVVYADIGTGSGPSALLSVMVMSGYLSALPADAANKYEISIPNLEMTEVFKDKFVTRLGYAGGRIADLSASISSGDVQGVARALESFAMSMDPKIMSHEHSYEIMCIALLMHLEGPYEIFNELHSGKGYCDVLLKSRTAGLPHVLMELKRWKDGDPDIDNLSGSGLKQIHDKSYTHMLRGTVILYGIAFKGTDVSVKTETIVQRRASGQ